MTKKHLRALWHFYKGILPFILAFTALCSLIFGPFIAFVLYILMGQVVGFGVFSLINKQEFYFYYNLGYTKWKLFKATFSFTIAIGTPIVIVLLIIIHLIFGDIKLI